MNTRLVLCALIAAFGLSGCDTFKDKNKIPLEGERISVLELQKELEPDDAALEAQGLVMPAAWRNEFWPQNGGYPNHSMQNLALSETTLSQAWSVNIGRGSTDELPLTAQPIVVDGRVVTLDTGSTLSAFSVSNGQKLWETDVSDPDEDDPVISGGVSYGEGLLYVTSGYDEVLAVKPGDGAIAWRKNLPGPSRAAPTVVDGRLYVTTLDNRLLALSAQDGALIWEYNGLQETAGLVGAASPAVSRDIVVPVFSSGEITALRVENGSVAWSDNLSNLRRIGGLAGLADIKALPVIDKGIVVAISFSGKLVALDELSGNRIWQREIGGANTPWMAGNHLFVLSSDNELVALGRENGVIRWVTKLAKYEKPDDRSGPILWNGPVLAGGRLILTGTRGRVIEVNPETGKVVHQWDAGETVMIPPVVAGETLYLLTESGKLTAYR